jgi:uncharacterized protein
VDDPADTLDLWDWRRRVADLYAAVRDGGPGPGPWHRWREQRDRLFREHPQSPLDPGARTSFGALPYFGYDPAWRVTGTVEAADPASFGIDHGGDGETGFRRFGRVRFEVAGSSCTLALYWLLGYGGGAFLPFRDATSGRETYGGGRYLLDTAKGADLGSDGGEIVLDFNYAYHPSCVHSPRWSCPLAPPENHLEMAVTAGERLR